MDKLAEVVRLSSAVAAQVRYAQIVGGPLRREQVEALLDAARLLLAYDVPWPPLVEQVLHDITQAIETADAEGGSGEQPLT